MVDSLTALPKVSVEAAGILQGAGIQAVGFPLRQRQMKAALLFEAVESRISFAFVAM